MGKLLTAALTLLGLSLSAGAVSAKDMTWPTSRMPIAVYIEPSKEPGYKPVLAAIVRNAFDEWTMAGGGKISFIFVDKPGSDAKIVVHWTHDRSKMQSSKEDGQTTLIADGQGIVSAEILLLTVPPPAMKTLADNYVRRIALHEVGHALGIAVHSANGSDIMCGTILPVDKPCAIAAGDVQALASLYTPRSATESAPEQSHDVNSANPQSGAAQVGTSASLNLTPNGDSPQLRSIRLNNEASMAMQSGQPALALSKLEEALKVDPGNKLTQANLGLTYANMSTMAVMQRNMPQAENYAKKAIPLIEQTGNKGNLFAALRTYALILHMQGKEPEAIKIEARMSALTGNTGTSTSSGTSTNTGK